MSFLTKSQLEYKLNKTNEKFAKPSYQKTLLKHLNEDFANMFDGFKEFESLDQVKKHIKQLTNDIQTMGKTINNSDTIIFFIKNGEHEMYYYVSERLAKSELVAAMLLSTGKEVYKMLQDSLKSSVPLAYLAIKNSMFAYLRDLTPELKAIPNIIINAMAYNNVSIKEVSDYNTEFFTESDNLKTVFLCHGNIDGFEEVVPKEFQTNFDIIKCALDNGYSIEDLGLAKKDPLILEYANKKSKKLQESINELKEEQENNVDEDGFEIIDLSENNVKKKGKKEKTK